MDNFTHQFFKDSGTMVLTINDANVLDNSGEVVQFYMDKIAGGIHNWDVDLRPLDLIYSAGLGMLIAFNASVASRGGRLRLILKKESKVTNLIRLTKIDRIVNVVII